MTEVNVQPGTTEPEREVVHVHEVDDTATSAGVNFVATLVALVVLVALVGLMFYVLPSLLGTSSVTINVRTQ